MVKIRLKTTNGLKLIDDLEPDSHIRLLLDRVEKLSSIKVINQKLFHGYPPKAIIIHELDDPMADYNIRNGDTLIVEEAVNGSVVLDEDSTPTTKESKFHGQIQRKIVPADNSCVFASIAYCILGPEYTASDLHEMRVSVSSEVGANTKEYTTAILGRKPSDYRKWIVKSDSWGGAIDILILSKLHSIEICVVNIQSCRIDRFGESEHYANRILIMYDGIHYDALYFEQTDSHQTMQTVFPLNWDFILDLARELAEEARQSRQFTDLSRFSLRCIICNKFLTGQSEGILHAKATGHDKFGEIS